MKKFAVAVAALAVTGLAYAGVLGVLTQSETATSLNGKLVWRCVYNVAGTNNTIILPNVCPQSMEFE